jgi:hypothetical protein
MSEDKGHILGGTKACEPVPGKHAFSTDNGVLEVWLYRLEKSIWLCWQAPVKVDLAMLVKDTDIHGPGMEIYTAVEIVRPRNLGNSVKSVKTTPCWLAKNPNRHVASGEGLYNE